MILSCCLLRKARQLNKTYGLHVTPIIDLRRYNHG